MQATIGLSVADRIGLPRSKVMDALLVISGAALVSLLAQIRIPLPFSPVPITGQTFGVLLIGAGLGAGRGAASLALYLGLGAVGLPVFAGGAGGLARFTGPTAGYLIGFVAAGWLVGRLAELGWGHGVRSSVPLFLIGQAVMYLFGVGWLATFIGLPSALVQGLLPFLPLDGIKVGLAAAVLPSTWQLIGDIPRN
ncbi:MAG: biotin transporter BioY [Anaerolineales bacterium]